MKKEEDLMHVLILGDRARYDAYMPDFARGLDMTLTDLPVDTPWEQVAAKAPETQIILADAIAEIDGAKMDALPGLKLIHSDGVGYNGIDTRAAKERGILVCNCKGCNADAVGEVTVMLMLMLTRMAVPGYRSVVEGRQMEYKQAYMRASAPEFADHVIGLVGLGDIAQATVKRVRPFGNKIYYYAPHRRSPQLEGELGVEYLPLKELVSACDILSLHCAATAETVGMVDRELLGRMKPGSYLVNTARGQLLDNEAVREALLSGHLAGAGFDTLWPEPTPADHPLVELPAEVRDRVVYLPHLGGNTGPSFRRAYTTVWENTRAVLEGERPVNIVNGL